MQLPLMRRLGPGLSAAVIVLLAPVIAAETVFHVAPGGNDANPGGPDAPFASLPHAISAARGADAATIVVHDGTYSLQAPLELTAADSGLTIRAAGAEKPVISGGRRITGWRQTDGGLWTAHIPEAASGAWRFQQLFVNGRRAVRARTPNEFYSYLKHVEEKITETGDTRAPKEAEQRLVLLPDDFQVLAGLHEDALQGVNFVAYHKWNITRRPIARLEADAHALVITGPAMASWNPLKAGIRYHLENFREALDAPGEWFLAHDGALFYYPLPGEDMTAAEVFAPFLSRLLVFQGDPVSGASVARVTIKGLAFRHADPPSSIQNFGPAQAAATIEAAVMADHARQITIEDCEIGHVGGYGVWFRKDCRECVLRQSLVHDLGAGGIRIGENAQAPSPEKETAFIVVDNNIIRQGGRIYPCAVGLWIGFSPDNQISHNEIADFFYTGISVGWRWGYAESSAKRNMIEYNHVHHIGQGMLSDMGGIYTLGPSEGTAVRNNVFHDVYAHGYGGWGLYTDEGSTGILFENNLVYNVKTGGFHQHYGRENTVRNNILAFSELYQLQATRVEEHLSFTLENNIVFWSRGVLLQGPWDKIQHVSRNNCFWHAQGAPIVFAGKSLEEWQAAGHEEASIIADPQFANPEAFDFHLASDSPALKTGFIPFDPSQAGVYGKAAWIREAREAEYPPLRLPPPPPEGIPAAD